MRFKALEDHGRRVQALDQAKGMLLVAPLHQGAPATGQRFDAASHERLSQGACVGLVANWLSEKINLSNGRLDRRPKNFSGPRTQAQFAATMHKAGRAQLEYLEDPHDLCRPLRAAGLDVTPMVPRNEHEPPWPWKLSGRLDYNFHHMCAHLARGEGAMMVTTVRDGGGAVEGVHATAIYKSRSEKFYFFDPNVGIYQMTSPAQFIKAWQESQPDKSIAIGIGHHNGFYQCRRPAATLGKRISASVAALSGKTP